MEHASPASKNAPPMAVWAVAFASYHNLIFWCLMCRDTWSHFNGAFSVLNVVCSAAYAWLLLKTGYVGARQPAEEAVHFILKIINPPINTLNQEKHKK